MVDGTPLPNQRRWPLAVLIAITLGGLALRLTNTFESLWLDELHTGWVVKNAWSEVAWRAQIGNQSPLWFYAVKAITTIAGDSELTLRLLSLCAGTALIPVVYWLVMLFAKSQADGDHASFPGAALSALLAAALVAVDPNAIFYATEARPYACLQLVAAIQLGLFWQVLMQPTTRQRLAWIVLTALAFHLHYTGILILAGELIALLAYYLLSRQTAAYRPWRALFDWQLAVMLCLPALPHVLQVAHRRHLWESMSNRPDLAGLWHIFPMEILAGAGALACLGALVWRSRKTQTITRSGWTALALVLVWFVLPVLAAFICARFDVARLFLPRYLMAVAIGPLLLTGLLMHQLPWRKLQVFATLGVLAFALYDGQIIAQLRYDGRAVGDRDEDWRGALAWLREQQTSRPWPVEVYSALIEEDDPWREERYPPVRFREYLQFPLHSLYALDAQGDDRPDAPPNKWIVHRGSLEGGMSCILTPMDLATRNRSLLKQRSFGDIHVSEWGPQEH